MKNTQLITLLVVGSLIFGCTTSAPVLKSAAYRQLYVEKPLTILLMPPINRTTNVDAKEYFHATLATTLAEKGFYVLPTFMSMDILRRESAYDAELFVSAPLNKFGSVFGADVVLFTIVHKWEKSALMSTVKINIEYLLKSVKTDEVLFQRRGNVTYDVSVNSGSSGLAGLAVSMIASAINTAATKYVSVARMANEYTLSDLPFGKYSTTFMQDTAQVAGPKEFNVVVK